MKHYLILAFLLVCAVNSAIGQNLIASPKLVNNPDPEYPAEAASLGYGGTIIVRAAINKRGEVSVTNAFVFQTKRPANRNNKKSCGRNGKAAPIRTAD